MAICYQDSKMRDLYSHYPEVLFVDATHKLNELCMPLYVLLVEDGNGESEVVAIWIVVNEDSSSIKKMVDRFKRHNEHWDKTVTVITDKDFVERDTFKDEFPQASLQICLFHVLTTFKREITSVRLNYSARTKACIGNTVGRDIFAAAIIRGHKKIQLKTMETARVLL